MSRCAPASASSCARSRRARCAACVGSLGVAVTRRVAGTTAGRFVPALGAAAVAAYAYWDTLQVAKSAYRLLEPPPSA